MLSGYIKCKPSEIDLTAITGSVEHSFEMNKSLKLILVLLQVDTFKSDEMEAIKEINKDYQALEVSVKQQVNLDVVFYSKVKYLTYDHVTHYIVTTNELNGDKKYYSFKDEEGIIARIIYLWKGTLKTEALFGKTFEKTQQNTGKMQRKLTKKKKDTPSQDIVIHLKTYKVM